MTPGNLSRDSLVNVATTPPSRRHVKTSGGVPVTPNDRLASAPAATITSAGAAVILLLLAVFFRGGSRIHDKQPLATAAAD